MHKSPSHGHAGSIDDNPEQGWAARIIFGEPKDTDEFKGGGHDRSARALADGIRQLAERRYENDKSSKRHRAGGAVGLEGAWGAGKSTVIDIAQSKYLGPDYCVFTFDLWRHQADDFRRAFLEQFIQFVRTGFNPKGADGNHIHDESDQRLPIELDIHKIENTVRNRKTVTTTTHARRLNGVAVALIMFLPILPLVYAWLHPNIFKEFSLPKIGLLSEPFHWMIFGIALYLLAFVGACLRAFDSKSYPFKDDDFTGISRKIRGGASHLFNLSQRDQNNEVKQTIRDENPTTVEFRTTFEEILVPVQTAGKKIVFVLDNVDRLPVGNLPEIWAEMRSLVSGNGNDPRRSVVAVIPYDRDHVCQAFPPVRIPKIVVDEKGTHNVDRNNGKELETDVFEKTFDRIIKVSAPVPSDWKAYLFERIDQAAFKGEHGTEYREKLFRLLRHQMQREGAHPTPRRIISFVNDIGGLWVQWADSEIPIATVGLYVLHRSLIDRDLSILSRPHPVDVRYQRIVDDPDYAKHLAALAFNVESELANQVRLDLPIRKALSEENGYEALTAMAGSDGFYEIFPDVLRAQLSEWAVDSPESISQAAENIAKLDIPSEMGGAIWQIFADEVDTIKALEYEHVDLPGLYTLVSKQTRYRPEDIAMRIRSKFENRKLSEEDSGLDEMGKSWLSMMRQLSQAIQTAADDGRARSFWKTKTPTTLAGFNIGVIAAYPKNKVFNFDDITLSMKISDLSAAFIEMIEESISDYILCLPTIGHRLKEHSVAHIKRIAELIEAEEEIWSRGDLINASFLHFNLVPRAAFITAIKPAVQNGSLAEYAQWAAGEGHSDDCALTLFLSALVHGSSPIAVARGTAPSEAVTWYNTILEDCSDLGEEVLSRLADHITKYQEATSWLRRAVGKDLMPGLYIETLKILMEREFQIIDLMLVVKHFDKLIEIVGVDGATHVLRQIRLAEEDIAQALTGENAALVPTSMIEVLAAIGSDVAAKKTLQHVIAYIEALSDEQWESALADSSSEPLRLLVALQKNGGLQLKSSAFIQALVTTSTNVLEGSLNVDDLGEDWAHVFKAIPPSQYTPLRAQIVAAMHRTDITSQGADSFVRDLGVIAQKMRFSIDANTADMALQRFLWHLRSSDEVASTEYLKTHEAEISATLQTASSDEIRRAYLDAGTKSENDEEESEEE